MNKMLDDVRRDACKKLMECETEDSMILVDTADILVKLWHQAKREGLLSLEDTAYQLPVPEYGKMLCQRLVDGTEPDAVIEIGTNEYWKENPAGVESMIWYMYLRGMHGIQKGENRDILQTVFQTLMPLQCRSSWRERIEAEKEGEEADLISKLAVLSPVFENRELIEKIHELEQEIKAYDDRAVQRILRDVDNHELALCLYGLNEEARGKILDNMSHRMACIIKEDVIYLGDVEERDILKSTASILGIINKLCDSAEIVRGRNPDEK